MAAPPAGVGLWLSVAHVNISQHLKMFHRCERCVWQWQLGQQWPLNQSHMVYPPTNQPLAPLAFQQHSRHLVPSIKCLSWKCLERLPFPTMDPDR